MACSTPDSSKGDSKPDHRKDAEKYFNQFLDIILLNENIPNNILLVGRPSTGKSSFVNLLKSALLGYYEEVAQPGASHYGTVSQFTDRLKRYSNMGLNQREMNILITRMRDSGKYVSYDFQLPTLIDIPGIENDPEFILDLVLDGLVPDDANLSLPMKFGTAPVTDSTCQMKNCIDHIVFVASMKQDVPDPLFQTIFNMGYRKRGIPFTLIITHSDCNEISVAMASARRKQMEGILCISEDNHGTTHCLSNYCSRDPIDTERIHAYRVNFEKHKNALMAMLKMVRWRPRRLPCPKRSGLEIELRNLLRTTSQFVKDVNIPTRFMVLGCIFALLAIVVGRFVYIYLRRNDSDHNSDGLDQRCRWQ